MGKNSKSKWTTVSIKEIKEHPTMRLDAGYWIKKKEKEEKKVKKSQSKAYFKAVEDGHGRLE